ncbi:MAG: RagB/SusD family nutrient uptake outer membrane protein [Phaeodactylibacter sp.]|nr:RagB/SusD family nutrient uptake outer membrane protein [Phaeodactylibacter sp.]MCB9273603.1 RagB/SusD family nutrient uptake outer membrane protein [Lewinellaceae bacterium]
MKSVPLLFIHILLVSILLFPGCIPDDDNPIQDFLNAEARRFEKAPETVGFEYLQGAYTQLSLLQQYNRLWALEELTSDEAVQVPAGLDWDDNGAWRELSLHSWGPGHFAVRDCWTALIGGLGTAYNALQVFTLAEPSPEGDEIIAESRCLQAAFNYYFISLFGQVPAIDESGASVVYSREEAFNRTTAMLEDALGNLPEKTRFSDERALFRMNKAAARALLARLYLNQSEYTGSSAGETQAMNAVLGLCGEVINSGLYGLEPDYWDNFRTINAMNTGSAHELILTTWNGPDGGFTNSFAANTLNAAHFDQAAGWNGFCTLAEFYEKWDQQDPRFLGPRIDAVNAFLGFNTGYQLDANGDTLRLPDGSPLFYSIDFDFQAANPAAGARPVKYEPDGIQGNGLSGSANVYAIIRLAEVYLMKAEAQYRLGQAPEARASLNALRESRGAAPLSAVTEGDLLDEYGYECWWEGQRRSHLIRFGRFNAPNNIRPAGSGSYRTLFPIPQEALDANPQLKQNPGY